MKPKEPAKRPHNDLFRMELENLIDRRHELVRLSEVIDWEGIASEFGMLYVDRKGRPRIPTRLMAGLLYLKATFKHRCWAQEGHLDRNCLKGHLGDAINAVIAGAGQNLRMILKMLQLLLAWLLNWRLLSQRNRLAAADALLG